VHWPHEWQSPPRSCLRPSQWDTLVPSPRGQLQTVGPVAPRGRPLFDPLPCAARRRHHPGHIAATFSDLRGPAPASCAAIATASLCTTVPCKFEPRQKIASEPAAAPSCCCETWRDAVGVGQEQSMGGGDQRMGGWADVRRRGPRTCSANGNRIKVGVTLKTPNPLFLLWSTRVHSHPRSKLEMVFASLVSAQRGRASSHYRCSHSHVIIWRGCIDSVGERSKAGFPCPCCRSGCIAQTQAIHLSPLLLTYRRAG
jgi:hypothetical protein